MGQKRQQSIHTGPVLSLWLIAKIHVQWTYHAAGLNLIRPHQHAQKVGDLKAETPGDVLPVLSTTSNVEQVSIYMYLSI